MSKEERYVWKLREDWYDIIYDKKTNKRLRTDKESIVALLNQQDQRIAELEEQLKSAIVPKFKIGQEVWYLVDNNGKIKQAEILEIRIGSFGLYYELDFNGRFREEQYIFTTKEEAQAKLEELKGK